MPSELNVTAAGQSKDIRWTRIDNAVVLGREGDRSGSLFLKNDRIAPPPSDETIIDRTIDAAGHHAMAGGIDLHTHIGGGKLTIARMMMQAELTEPSSEPDSAESCEYLPTADVAARRYLDLGYTTCFEPAIIAGNARAAHLEMSRCRGLSTGGYCLLGNEPPLLAMIADGVARPIIAAYVAAMVAATGCIGVKVVNAGGIDAFKFNRRQLDVDDHHPRYDVTPGQVIRTLAQAVVDIGLRHPLHVHCSNLGVPGNIESTLATIRAADGLPIHLTHVQFHSYGKTEAGMTTAASRIADALRQHPNVTIDIGQVIFGQTVTVSADTMHQFTASSRADPKASYIADTGGGGGCGVVPFRYRRRRFVGALQWAIGMELLLMVSDPSRVFLTTDHPNGGPFTAYPHLLAMLADRTLREDMLQTIHPDAVDATEVAGIDREYSMDEIAVMTRSGPADVLGLSDRGRLRPGDIADVVLIRDDGDWQQRFEKPAMVIRGGKIVRRDGQTVDDGADQNTHQILAADRQRLAAFAADADHAATMVDYQNRYGGRGFGHLWIGDDEFPSVLNSQLTFTGDAT